ncbi:probable pectinesterase 29 [Punica granatum]|nr:probable pectinesterase 29 [Punica granatum]
MLWGDKASFYACGFVSLQDTLANMQGRHYFSQCYIESAVDFIWGYCQSIYEGCAINSKDAIVGGNPGYITAHGRLSPNDSRGFVFEQCTVNGDDTTFLGRAYRAYSRVVFSESELGGDVLPQGWDAWRGEGHEHVYFKKQKLEALNFLFLSLKLDTIKFSLGLYGPGPIST